MRVCGPCGQRVLGADGVGDEASGSGRRAAATHVGHADAPVHEPDRVVDFALPRVAKA
jgi:hypothetical protein